MANVSTIRIVALAVIAGGAAHVRSADAEPVAAFDACADYAHGYADGFCSASGYRTRSITYTCNADGSVTIVKVVCDKAVAPPL
jgi:hypothetical protein